MSDRLKTIREAAAGNWRSIISDLTHYPETTFDEGSKGQPCPKCGGNDRFNVFKDFERTGGLICRVCHNGTTSPVCGDGFATTAWLLDISFKEAVSRVAEHLGFYGSSNDILAKVATDKRIPLEAFLKFGAHAAHRRNRPVARVPIYDERGMQFSYFDLAPGEKGWFKSGKGNSGMFFPGRVPQAGETWVLVEGVKDAAALTGLGYLAAGMPSYQLPARFACLFAGCDVILVHDLDRAGLG